MKKFRQHTTTTMLLMGVLLFSSFYLIELDQDKKKKNKKGKKEQVNNISEFRQQVATYRLECRKDLKPFRYSFGKTTFFNYKPYNIRKEIEVAITLDAAYKFNFNAQGVSEKKIKVKVFDKSKEYNKRHLLFEKADVGGNTFSFTSSELYAKMKEHYQNEGLDQQQIDQIKLDRIYIDYIIPALEEERVINEQTGRTSAVVKRGAIVFASGYENLEAID